MPTELNTVDDFLKHRTRDSRSNYLSKWRDNKRVTVWFHTKQPIVAIWRHGGIPRVVCFEDKDTREQVTKIWPGQYVCHEDEGVLRRQNKRRPDGSREVAPKACPLCRLSEAVRERIDSGQLSWTKPILKFEGDEDSLVIHAGGLVGAFGRRDMEDEERLELKRAGIKLTEAWKENGGARLNYLFCVVDNDNVDAGVQIAIEGQSLGDKIIDVIADTRESWGREEGDPFLNPYAIQWLYDKQEERFDKKYKARKLEKVELTDEIRELITGTAPDVSRDVTPFNVKQLRGILEKAALVKLPWDEIFDVPAYHAAGDGDGADELGPRDKEAGGRQAGAIDRARPRAASQKGTAAPQRRGEEPKEETKRRDPEAEMVECDECGKAMREDAAECSHCGHVYVAAATKKDESPPPPPRKRSEAAQPGNKKAASSSRGGFFDDVDGDDIPF